MDSIRKEFDEWLRSQPHVLNVGFNQVTGKYLLAEDETAYQAWKAAIKSVVVDLPPKKDDNTFYSDDIINAIHSAGIRTK